jgi:hypothetical protein
VIELASFTGWSLAEILDMEEDDFYAWRRALPRKSARR